MLFLYNIAIRCYYCAIWLASFFNDKARLWIEGRRHNFQQLKSFQPAPGCKVVWLHAASLGEFEQGRPLLEAIKKQQPATQIILSFFSPSGYQIRKDYELADHVCYLPLDTATNAKAFVAAVQPDIAIFVKYEFWYHHLHALRSAGVRTFLVAGIFRKGQLFFKPYGGLFRNILHCFDVLLVQDDSSAQLLSKRLALPALVAGDPRVDRVLDIGASGRRFPKLEEFKGDSKVLIIGSSWPADEQLLARLFQEAAFAKWKFVLAPHEIGETHLRAIEKQFEPCVRYTQAGVKDLAKARILLVDTIGMLSSLYTYGNMAYIGGGFGAGIHNTLEPMAFELPVLFGPKYKKFQEAVALVERGGGFTVQDYDSLRSKATELLDDEARAKASAAVASLLEENKGATQKIMSHLERYLQ